MDTFLLDLRYALRLIRKSPLFAAVTVATIALGIGANTAIFSTVQAAILGPLPYADASRLVMVWEDAGYIGFPRNTPAPANYFDWKRMNRVFTDMAATRGSSANLTAAGPPEQVVGRSVTANFFDLLGVRPAIGRAFTTEEDDSGAAVVVISDGLWRRRYAGDRSVIGQQMLMSGVSRTIIGVMPRGFLFRDRDGDFWIPMHFTPQESARRTSHYLNVVARLKPGVSVTAARDDMARVAGQLAKDYPASNARIGSVVNPLREDLLGDTRAQLLVLMAAAGCVLLIACANLAGLLLVRGVARRGEIAVRSALGATRQRLVRQMMLEGLVLAAAGGIVALALAPVAMRVVERLVPNTIGAVRTSVFDLPVVGFTAAITLVTGLAFSLAPALQVSTASLAEALHHAARSAVGRRRLSSAMVVVQVAVTIVLLVAAGLLLRTLANLRQVDLGFQPDGVLTVRTTLPTQKYADGSRRLAFYDRVVDGVRALPNAANAAYTSNVPFALGNTNGYRIDAGVDAPDDARDALYRVGTNDYLQTLGVRLIAGRFFTPQDGPEAPRVVIVNETFARRHWPDESAIGHRITFTPAGTEPQWYTIVGVVHDVRERGYVRDMKPGVYLPFAQARDTWALPDMLVVRTGDPLALVPAVRRVVSEADPEQPLSAVRTLRDRIDADVADRHQQMTLIGAFAGLAVLLASIGLYGLLAYGVAERRREIGVRMALGATASRIVRTVAGQGVVLTGIGAAVGLVMALMATRALETLVFGVRATDPRTLAAAVGLFAVIGVVASALPAARAARVDPIRALRDE